MTCVSCGKEVDEKAKFCPECGAAIQYNVQLPTSIDSSAVVKKQVQTVQKKTKPAHRWPFIVMTLLIAAAIGLLTFAYFTTGMTKKNSITPYGVQWGDSPEMVMKKDRNATQGGVNGKGELTCRNETMYGSFFGMKNDAINSPVAIYRFQDNKLCGILYTCAINTSVISSDDFIDGIIEYFFSKYNREPDFQTIKFVWASEECTVEVTYMTDDLFFIEYNPS